MATSSFILALRHASIPPKRARSQQRKYRNFRRLNRGQRHAPHYLATCYWHARIDSCGFCLFPADLAAPPVRALSKREFYTTSLHLVISAY